MRRKPSLRIIGLGIFLLWGYLFTKLLVIDSEHQNPTDGWYGDGDGTRLSMSEQDALTFPKGPRRQMRVVLSQDNKTIPTKLKKPFFFIHPGPPKTGTTSLQSTLWEYRELLAEDSYFFLGKSDEHADEHHHDFGPVHYGLTRQKCIKRVNTHEERNKTIQEVVCWKPLLEELQKHHRQGHNLILSEEVISLFQVPFRGNIREPLDWDIMKETLSGWNVRIVIGYRRYFEWLLSTKNQQDRYSTSHLFLNKWVGQGGRYMRPILPHLLRMMEGSMKKDALPYPYTDTVVDTYQPNFPVILLNVHDEERSLVTQFLCDVLVEARAACQHHERKETLVEKRSNPSQSAIHYDILANFAHDIGLVQSDLPRPWVVQQAQHYHEVVMRQTLHDLKMTCPDFSQVEPLLTTSLEYERSLLPGFFSSLQGETKLRKSFLKYFEKQRFCTVDANATLNRNPTWVHFFKDLRLQYSIS